MKLFSKKSATKPLDDLPFFVGVDLSDSFVRSWTVNEDCLLFQVDASLWPQNPHYAAPKPGEYTCYKSATLVFCGISNLNTPEQDQIAAAYDSIEDGYDTIDCISYDSRSVQWLIEVGSLKFSFSCSGVRFDIAAA